MIEQVSIARKWWKVSEWKWGRIADFEEYNGHFIYRGVQGFSAGPVRVLFSKTVLKRM